MYPHLLINRITRKKFMTAAAVFAIVMAFCGTALAHAPVLWCYVEGGKVHVEAFFSSGAKIQGGKIYVVDQSGKKLLEGTTDKQGNFEFTPPVKDDMTIVLKVDSGHTADFEITKQDFIDAEKDEAGQK